MFDTYTKKLILPWKLDKPVILVILGKTTLKEHNA